MQHITSVPPNVQEATSQSTWAAPPNAQGATSQSPWAQGATSQSPWAAPPNVQGATSQSTWVVVAEVVRNVHDCRGAAGRNGLAKHSVG